MYKKVNVVLDSLAHSRKDDCSYKAIVWILDVTLYSFVASRCPMIITSIQYTKRFVSLVVTSPSR